MARIAGVDLPQNKQVWIGLTYIYGIGRTRSKSILTLPVYLGAAAAVVFAWRRRREGGAGFRFSGFRRSAPPGDAPPYPLRSR